MDDDFISPPPRRSVLFYLAAGLAALTIFLFFYWIFNLNRASQPAVQPPAAVAPVQSPIVIAAPERVAPTETPPLSDPPGGTGADASSTALLPNTSFTIISRPELSAGPPDASADRLEFVIDGTIRRFQLPGVEALVTATGKPDLRAAQAAFYRSSPEHTGSWGDHAADSTHGLLKQRNFKVFTNWQLAEPGVYYGHVFVDYEDDKWTFLTERLLAAGEARLTELPLLPPLRMATEKEFSERHRQAQDYAKRLKKGAWGTTTPGAP